MFLFVNIINSTILFRLKRLDWIWCECQERAAVETKRVRTHKDWILVMWLEITEEKKHYFNWKSIKNIANCKLILRTCNKLYEKLINYQWIRIGVMHKLQNKKS